jgi:hypothetical protein
MAPLKVALAGGTGMLGSPIRRALLAASIPTLLLTRPDSKTSVDPNPNLTIAPVDYDDIPSLTSLLKSEAVTVVISTLNPQGFSAQTSLITASVNSGTVTRFIPSEFGSDTTHPLNASLPVYTGKIAAFKHLEELSSQHPHFSYTLFFNNLFLDWGLLHAFILDPVKHEGTIYNGGDIPSSATTLRTIGKAIVGVVQHLDETANKAVYVHDTVITQNRLIAMCKYIDGRPWTLTPADTETVKQHSYAELQKEKPDYAKAMYGFLPTAVWGRENGGDFSGKTEWNKLFGIQEMGEGEVKGMLGRILRGEWEY